MACHRSPSLSSRPHTRCHSRSRVTSCHHAAIHGSRCCSVQTAQLQPTAERRSQQPTTTCRAAPAASAVETTTASDQAAVTTAARRGRMLAAVAAGPVDEPPSYEGIDSKPYNRLFMHLFRSAVVDALGEDAPEPGFDGIITLTRRLSSKFSDPRDSQQLVRGILASLFPSWLLPAFRVMFAKPLPGFSKWLNARVTAQACQWLMGPCKVNAVEYEDGTRREGEGVKVERCRVLEQSGCASVCVNCCKIPTQEFFEKDMGIELRMTPNYEDFSCQFDFGRQPLPPEQDEALASPCFIQCPSKSAHRSEPKCGGLEFDEASPAASTFRKV